MEKLNNNLLFIFPPKCAGCGKFMRLKEEGSYLLFYSYVCHIKESCINKTVLKVKEHHSDFKLATFKEYTREYE